MATDDKDEVEFRDLSELGELCGCTDLQRKFAEGLLAGLSQTEAAFRAGYAGERSGAQLRSTASSVAQAKPVQALLALAESRGLGVPNAPGDREELLRILWSHARSKDKQTSVRAAVELDRIGKEEREGHDGQTQEAALRDILARKYGAILFSLVVLEIVEERGPRFSLTGAVPWLKEVAPLLAQAFPEFWQRIRSGLDSDCQRDADAMASGPVVPLDQLFAKPNGKSNAADQPN
jgi:hypothetical protein